MKKIKKFFLKKGEILGIDAGRLDLCSGHVQTGEPTCITMQRELKEELGIETTVSRLKNLGTVVVDYTKLKDETNRKNLKCFIEIYGTKIQDYNQIKIDEDEVIRHRMAKYK